VVVAGLVLIGYAALMYLVRRQSAPTGRNRLAAPVLVAVLGIAMVMAQASTVVAGVLVVVAGGGAVVMFVTAR
jgi:hypothetical protein